MEKLLITGGKGYIGQYLVRYFKEFGYQVYYTSRKQKDLIDESVRYLNLNDEESFVDLCRGMDVIIHTATMDERKIKENAKAALEMNAYGTRQLYLDAIKCNVKKFIYFSTFHVYGCKYGTIDEDTKPQPVSDYGLTHYFAEQYLQQLSKGSVCTVDVIRLTNGVGMPLGNIDRWYLAMNDFCRNAFRKQKIKLQSSGLSMRDFIAIEDVVYAVKALVERKEAGQFEIFNVSAQHSVSIREAAEKVADIYTERYGNKCELLIPENTGKQQNADKKLMVLSRKIRKLGWKPKITLENTIHDIFSQIEQRSEVEWDG